MWHCYLANQKGLQGDHSSTVERLVANEEVVGSSPTDRSISTMPKTWEEVSAQLHAEALARGQRYKAIIAQSPEAALNDLKLQSSSPIWEEPSYIHRFMSLSDEEIEENVVRHQEFREQIRLQNEEDQREANRT